MHRIRSLPRALSKLNVTLSPHSETTDSRLRGNGGIVVLLVESLHRHSPRTRIHLTLFEFENCQRTKGFSWNYALPD
jgi:hypothetical protein